MGKRRLGAKAAKERHQKVTVKREETLEGGTNTEDAPDKEFVTGMLEVDGGNREKSIPRRE